MAKPYNHTSLFWTKLLCFIVGLALTPECIPLNWGFFGHKLINRQAVYILPDNLYRYFRPHIEYITLHAVDPDKRRYAIRQEAVRHYFDVESWSPSGFNTTAKRFGQDMSSLGDIIQVCASDTSLIMKTDTVQSIDFLRYVDKSARFVGLDSVQQVRLGLGPISDNCELLLRRALVSHGVLPWAILDFYHKLRSSFEKQDLEKAIQYASNLGHYIGDAHVPLHTTVNYNGQLTNQLGIHAFWETRIPELFAESEFDLYTGRAQYIDDVDQYIWSIILHSHSLVDMVLTKEKEIRLDHQSDQIKCPIDRGGQIQFLECEEYARAYMNSLGDMVNVQLKNAIHAVANIWWTAYVDAGQPLLLPINEIEEISTGNSKAVTKGRRCK